MAIRLLKQYPFFLALLPAFVVVHLEKELPGLIPYEFVADRILLLFLVPLFLLAVTYFFFRSIRKASLLSFACQIVFYFTGDLKNWIARLAPRSFWQSYIFLLSVSLIVLLVLYWKLRKTGPELKRPYLVLNTALLLFILADLVQLFVADNKQKYSPVTETVIANSSCDSCERPDIYYIILDAYASSAQLASEFNYPNDRFETDLNNKGFRIAANSKSNYNYTAFSMGSVFHMNYLKGVDTVHRTVDRSYLQALKLVYRNPLISFFKKENYRIYNHSLFDFDSIPTTIRHIDFWGIRELFDQYNLVLKLHQDIGYHFPDPVKKIFDNRYFVNSPANRKKLDSLAYHHLLQTARTPTPEPKFVYTHFLRPHPPFIFDSTGGLLSPATGWHEAYVHQVTYLNKLIINITDTLLANVKRPAVIIIQGDHGYTLNGPGGEKDKFSNFTAFYFRDKNYGLIPDSLTNVNTFRIVLNTFFKKELEMLPGQFYHLWQ